MRLTVIEQDKKAWIGIPEEGTISGYKKLAPLTRDLYDACISYGYPRVATNLSGHKTISYGDPNIPMLMQATRDPNADGEWTLMLVGLGQVGNISDEDAVKLASGTDVNFVNGLPEGTAEARILAMEEQATRLIEQGAKIRNEARSLRVRNGLCEETNEWKNMF